MRLMDWPTNFAKAIAIAASSKWTVRVVLALSLSAPILMGILIWKLHTSVQPTALVENRNSAVASNLAPQNTPNVFSASTSENESSTGSNPTSADASNSTSSCETILNAGNKALNALNSQVSQDLSQAKKYASTGDFADAGVIATQANQLSAQGSSEQTKYQQQLSASHCNGQITSQLGQ
jgi:hypothetical protein